MAKWQKYLGRLLCKCGTNEGKQAITWTSKFGWHSKYGRSLIIPPIPSSRVKKGTTFLLQLTITHNSLYFIATDVRREIAYIPWVCNNAPIIHNTVLIVSELFFSGVYLHIFSDHDPQLLYHCVLPTYFSMNPFSIIMNFQIYFLAVLYKAITHSLGCPTREYGLWLWGIWRYCPFLFIFKATHNEGI